MKLLKKLKERIIVNFKTDVLGEFKNVLLVGNDRNFEQQLLSDLNQYFNIFHIYSKEQYEDQKLLYQSTYDCSLDTENYMQQILKDINENLKTRKKVEFDAILNFTNLPIKQHNNNIFIQNQNLLKSQIERNLLTLQIARQHLAFKGSVINIVDFPSFSGQSDDIIQNLSVSNQLDLFYRLSTQHQDINDHRFLYLITDDEKNLQDKNNYYQQIVRTIFKWILRRGIPEDNSIIHFKQKQDKKIYPEFLQVILKKQKFLGSEVNNYVNQICIPCPICIVSFFDDRIDLDLLLLRLCFFNCRSDLSYFLLISEFSSLKAMLFLNLSN